MADTESLGLLKLDSAHWYVTDLARARDFYTRWLDFEESGESDEELSARAHQKSAVFTAGDIQLICSQPLSPDSRAG
ncbi:MAG: VOC family protein, partial [Deltaproteobacteria bacterium]|nr:VOC family protein [Deltaproteobacteria bacterium]